MAENTDRKIDWKEESRRFDGVADFYETYRPSYPQELVDHIITRSGIPPGGQILEIGSGTGRATHLFAQRGFSLLCIEQGQNLINVAAQKLKPFQVEFVPVPFEAWDETQTGFDLAISAQAFHWIPKEIGYAKVARVLKKQGYLALFWNMYPDLEGDLAADLRQVYQAYAPELAGPNKYETRISRHEQDVRESGFFDLLEVKRFPWSMTYDTQQYLGLLNTYSDYLRLPEQRRAKLLEAITEVVNRHGGTVEKPYLAVLYLAKRR